MPKLTTNQYTSTEQEVTPEFCFQKAAECLAGGYSTNNSASPAETAREWRELGITLTKVGTPAPEAQ